MTIAKVLGAVVIGLEGVIVEAEAMVHAGPRGLQLIGLTDQAAWTCRDRVRAAASNSGVSWTAQQVAVSLYPVNMPKPGGTLDLAIAVSVLAAAGTIPTQGLGTTMFLAELGLNGVVRPVRGVLPAVRAAADHGVATVVVAPENAAEAAVVDGVRVLAPRTLGELVGRLRNSRWLAEPDDGPDVAPPPADGWNLPWRPWETHRSAPPVELAQVPIPAVARRAVEVAAAGGHDMLLLGHRGPHAGRAMGRVLVAEALAALMPPLDWPERLAAATVSSVAGVLDAADPAPSTPVFEAPHHTVTATGLTGRITPVGSLVPGAMVRARHGVLFIEDAPELDRRVLERLHDAVTAQQIRLRRGACDVAIPLQFQLVLGASMCPCEITRTDGCSCPPLAQHRYRRRIRPLAEDLPVKLALATAPAEVGGESTAAVAARVQAARDRARARLAGTPWTTNAQVPAAAMVRRFLPGDRALDLLHRQRGSRSLITFSQVLQVAWTLADLAGLPVPGPEQVDQAFALHDMPPELTGETAFPNFEPPESESTEPE